MIHPSAAGFQAGGRRIGGEGRGLAGALAGALTCALLAGGCQTSFGGKDDTALTDDSGGGGGGDDGTGVEEGIPGLKDIREEMARNADNCQELQGDALPGANSYFWGEYEGNEAEGWFGTEKFYVFVNDTLAEDGATDCEVTWVVTGGYTAPAACSGCEVGMDVTATLDSSTCEQGMADDANFSVTYSVDQISGGDARWFFGSSGTELGTGYWNEKGMNYLTEPSCRWF